MVFSLVFVVRENRGEMIPCGVTAAGQFHGVGKGFGAIRQMPGHLFGRFQPLSGLDHCFQGKGAQGAVERDGPHQAVQRIILRLGKIDRIGRNGRDSQASGQLQRLAAGGSGHNLDPALGPGTQRLDDVRAGAEYRKVSPCLGKVSEQGKIRIEVALSEQFGEQFITLWGFDQDDGVRGEG